MADKEKILNGSDAHLYNERVKEISRILDLLDQERPPSPRINNSIYILSNKKNCSLTEIENLYKNDPELFFKEPRIYGITVKDPGVSFSREHLKEFTYATNYFTQTILEELWRWEKEKSQEV